MKFIPREKLSKKAKRTLDEKRRATWEGLNPVTRQTANRKTYDRKRPARFDEDRPGGLFHFIKYMCYNGKRQEEIRL